MGGSSSNKGFHNVKGTKALVAGGRLDCCHVISYCLQPSPLVPSVSLKSSLTANASPSYH